jgi:hypothetical protein
VKGEPFLIILITLVVLFFILLLSGIYHLLHAVWELREGAVRHAFVRRGMLACGLLFAAFVLPFVAVVLASIPVTYHVSS